MKRRTGGPGHLVLSEMGSNWKALKREMICSQLGFKMITLAAKLNTAIRGQKKKPEISQEALKIIQARSDRFCT